MLTVKKRFSVFLILILILVLCGCSVDANKNPDLHNETRAQQIVTTTEKDVVTWEKSAVELIQTYYVKTSNYTQNDGIFFYLLDINSDGAPEIFQGPIGGTGKPTIFSFFYWNGIEYVEGRIDAGDNDSDRVYIPEAYLNKETNEFEFWDNVMPEDVRKDTHKIYWYATSGKFCLENGVLKYSEIYDYHDQTSILMNSFSYSEDEVNLAFNILVQKKNEFYNKRQKVDSVNEAYKSYLLTGTDFIHEGSTLENYQSIVTRYEAERVVENYKNGTKIDFRKMI